MSDTFGSRLRALRERAEETQPALAHELQTNPTTVSRWERDQGMPHTDQVIAIARHYGVSTDYLLTGQQDELPPDNEAFAKFLATEWGRIAQKHGWLDAVRRMRHPFQPTVELYIDYVMALMRAQDRQRGNS